MGEEQATPAPQAAPIQQVVQLKTIREMLGSAFVHSLTVVFAAFLFTELVIALSQTGAVGFANIKSVLYHHACGTKFSFFLLSIGVACPCLMFVASKAFEKPIFWLGNSLILVLAHMLLAGLGFGVALVVSTDVTHLGRLELIWFFCGFVTYVLATVLSEPVTYKDSEFKIIQVAGFLGLVSSIGFFWLVGKGGGNFVMFTVEKVCALPH